ncbi:alpha/beta fold hydrolase [Hoeflea sp. TYP-13]|uniref:alpha/beta fold hydrolase n=1 Tax=Hoeflea sp. TYP-13 TaxID=3230023 RepID=UPI0034C5B354
MTWKTLPRYETASGAAYQVCGDGESVVLLHGVGLRAEAWAPQTTALSSRWRVYAVDLPGHGQSRPLSPRAELSDYVCWLRDVLADLDVGPVNIAGHSMGALISLGIAVEEPAMIRRMAMLNGVYKRSAEASKAVRDRATQIRCGNMNIQQPLDRWFTDMVADQTARVQTEKMLAGVDPSAYATAYNAFARGDQTYADRLSEVRCPALFLTGDGDLNSTGEMAQQMAAAVPDGVTEIIEGHRHMVGLTAPEAVNNALITWLGREQRAR